MNSSNIANPTAPEVGKHVYVTIDGKTNGWATIAAVNKDGTLDLNVHDGNGLIVGGLAAVEQAESMNHSVPRRWWV